jgi:hypothetical protein
MAKTTTQKKQGKLKIGDNWNAITIIALSQNNPLKAIAEFVENSIDARATRITIIRGKQGGKTYLKIVDNGEGIDDFRYVATHIGDSIKRKLKQEGVSGIQGEFGIGLLSFWTVGEELVISSSGKEGVARRMKLVKNNPGYSITDIESLFDHSWTELFIMPILPGVKQLSGEKIQNYLASELRDRISKTGVEIRIKDKLNRKELVVEPRKYTGRLLHNLPLPKSPLGEIYAELYLTEPSPENSVSLFKKGTRVVPSIKDIDPLNRPPWNSPYLEGLIDVDFLQLTPGTRGGVILDEAFENFMHSIRELEESLMELIEEQKRAEEDHASKNILKRITKALREAMRRLPINEYEWLNIHSERKTSVTARDGKNAGVGEGAEEESTVYAVEEKQETEVKQKAFFEYPGPLYSCAVRPGSVIMKCGESKDLRAVAMDKSKRVIDTGVKFLWEIKSGDGKLSDTDTEITTFAAPPEPGIVNVGLLAQQDDTVTEAEALITITKELIDEKDVPQDKDKKGLPGYTYQNSPGELWRSRFDQEKRIIYINNGHADFIYASRSNSRKLKYIFKLFSKELVSANFPELNTNQLMEKMIELQLYSEESL